jgi:hypothetical protein
LPKTKCKNANHNSTLFRFLKILLDWSHSADLGSV